MFRQSSSATIRPISAGISISANYPVCAPSAARPSTNTFLFWKHKETGCRNWHPVRYLQTEIIHLSMFCLYTDCLFIYTRKHKHSPVVLFNACYISVFHHRGNLFSYNSKLLAQDISQIGQANNFKFGNTVQDIHPKFSIFPRTTI